MNSNRRSDRNRAEKYSRRAAVMLDQFHWSIPESHFLALTETAAMTVGEIRELTWARIKDSFEGLMFAGQLLHLRVEYTESFREHLASGKSFYGEDIASPEGSPKVFRREDLKKVTKELDQFRE